MNPDDWDGDGIPNGEDDGPRVAADEPRFGPRQSQPPGAHTDNYFWVDLAVRDADALVSFAGGGACGCGGCSTGEMTFSLEGCAFTFGGWSCSCSHVPPDRSGEGDDGEPDPLPGASARFTPRAVIFEGAYEPSDGVKVPRRSTRTTLVCSASGGPNGGTARFEATGDDCVLRVSGPTLPLERRLGPGESFEAEVVYEGQKGLGHGFRVTASFTDDSEDAQTAESVARLDVAEIEIMVREYASANGSPWRHTFGVCEEISCNSYPSGIGLRWIADEGVMTARHRGPQPPLPVLRREAWTRWMDWPAAGVFRDSARRVVQVASHGGSPGYGREAHGLFRASRLRCHWLPFGGDGRGEVAGARQGQPHGRV